MEKNQITTVSNKQTETKENRSLVFNQFLKESKNKNELFVILIKFSYRNIFDQNGLVQLY